MGKSAGIVAGVAVTFAVIISILWRNGIIGSGYAVWGAGEGKEVQVSNAMLLSTIASEIKRAGGIGGTILWVKPGVDVQAKYVGSLPSRDKPIVAISGCRKPVKVLGLISILRVEVDGEWVKKVWGEEADRRINALMLNCLIYGMSRGNERVFGAAARSAVSAMAGERMFGLGVKESP